MAEQPHDLSEECTYPKGFFCRMHQQDILSFSHQQGNDALFLQTPGYGSAIDHENVATGQVVVFLQGPVSITEPWEAVLASSSSFEVSTAANYQ